MGNEKKTMDRSKSYNTSRDYKHLKELLDNGAVVVGFTTYDFDQFNKDPNHIPIITTDVLCAFKNQNIYMFSVRGQGYGDYDPAYHKFSFEAFCESLRLEYIEPTKDVNTKVISNEELGKLRKEYRK